MDLRPWRFESSLRHHITVFEVPKRPRRNRKPADLLGVRVLLRYLTLAEPRLRRRESHSCPPPRRRRGSRAAPGVLTRVESAHTGRDASSRRSAGPELGRHHRETKDPISRIARSTLPRRSNTCLSMTAGTSVDDGRVERAKNACCARRSLLVQFCVPLCHKCAL